MAEKEQPLTCNRTEKCRCGRKRRARQTSADVANDVFFICPNCDEISPSKKAVQ